MRRRGLIATAMHKSWKSIPRLQHWSSASLQPKSRNKSASTFCMGARNLKKLAMDNLVDGLDYDMLERIGFCESCAEGKHNRSQLVSNKWWQVVQGTT